MFTTRVLTASAVLATVGVLASACGSGGGSPSAADAGSNVQGSRMPGAFGEIAAVTGRTLQVQNQQSGQVAVTIGAKTSVLDTVAATRSAVTVGSCVVVRSASDGSGASGSSDTSGTPTKVSASSVSVTASTSGSACGMGRRGGRAPGGSDGSMPEGAPSGVPSGMPSDAPSGMPSAGAGGGRRMGFGVAGKVTAVTGGGFTVTAVRPGSGSSTVTVTTSGSTTYTVQKKAGRSALKVGRCIVATGTSDSTGAVAATSATVSDKVDGSCAMGAGFAGGRPGSGA